MTMIAGPCAVESEEDTKAIAEELAAYNKNIILRGGCWKPRTFPNSFQGLGYTGVDILYRACVENGLKTMCLEVMDYEQIDYVLKRYSNIKPIFQIGSRNMQNFSLLKEFSFLPEYTVLLKRGFGCTVEEFIGAREYIRHDNVILCERGIRTFSDSSRFTLDIAAIPYLKQKTGCEIIVDPSHAAGETKLVAPLARAAIAAGADGLEIEVKSAKIPTLRKCDNNQAIDTNDFYQLANDCNTIRDIVSRNERGRS